jgi:hypothetical protein
MAPFIDELQIDGMSVDADGTDEKERLSCEGGTK